MKNKPNIIEFTGLLCVITFVLIGHFYVEKHFALSNPSIKIIKSKPFEIIGMLLMIACIFFGFLIQEWWQKKYPPKTNSTDSEVIDNNPPKDGNITE